jgi:hypothetical protein
VIRLLHDERSQRRTLFLLANLAACLLIVVFIVEPIWTLFSERAGYIANQQRMLSRLQAIAAQSEYIHSLGMDAESQIKSGEYLVGPNENVVSADLQTRLKTLMEAGGARPRAVQALAAKTSEGTRYVGARIEITGPIKSIFRAVYDVESAKPYLFISGATIRPVTSVGRSGVPPDEPALQAQLDVVGAVQSGRGQ